MLIVVAFTLAAISAALSASTHTCNGTVDFSIIYEDGQIRNISVDGVSGTTDNETVTPNPDALQRFRFTGRESFAGENGIEINNERRHVQLIPGGRAGLYAVHLLDYATKVWNTIDVYCQPLGLAYRPESDEIVGFCRVNTTYHDGTITCVPYFILRIQNDKWVDGSQSGSCSQRLSTVNITNPVILQVADSDDEVDAVRLYFGERGTNRLHEVSLSGGESNLYNADAMLKIDHLVQASNTSLRVICRVENSSEFYQKLFLWQTDSIQQQQTGFVSGFVQTESTAFDSYNLDYLVTFNANRNTVIIKEDGGSNRFQLSHALDDPIQCQNLVGPATHYLICPAENGSLLLLLNITSNSVTNQTIPVDESKRIIKIGRLAENQFYLLNDRQEISVYLIAATVTCVGTYTVRPNTDFIITAASGNINCTVMEDVDPHSDSDKSRSATVVAIVVSVIVAAVIIIILAVVFIVVIVKLQIKKEHDCSGSISTDIAQPTLENGYTGERSAEDPPTSSIDPSEEVGGNHHGALVHSTLQDFPNAATDPTRKGQSENNSDDTQCMEQKSEDCIVPLECAEDNLPAREDPIGDESK